MAGLPLWVRNAPGTAALLAATTVGFVATWAQPESLYANFALTPGDVRAWPYVTYPFVFVTASLVFTVLSALWLWVMGSQLERQIGTRSLLALFGAATVVSGLVFSLTAGGLRLDGAASGPLLPVAVLTSVWASKNRTAQVALFGIIPIRAAWVAALGVLSVVYSYGFGAPVLGLVCAVPSAAAWFLANGVPWLGRRAESVGRGPAMGGKEFDAYRDRVRRREKEREEQERLRRLFEGGDPPQQD
jgi:membrane associated rhomboid family serine protease